MHRGVEVVGVREMSKEALAAIKEGEEHKEKTYEALCWIPRPLTPADVALLGRQRDLDVRQATPVRVLHRRAPLTRTKVRQATPVCVLHCTAPLIRIKVHSKCRGRPCLGHRGR